MHNNGANITKNKSDRRIKKGRSKKTRKIEREDHRGILTLITAILTSMQYKITRSMEDIKG